MKKLIISLFLILGSTITFSQDLKSYIILSDEIITNVKTFPLPQEVSASSGLSRYGDFILTHNDHYKGNIYVLDTLGDMVDSIETGLNFIDLEDIAQDERYIYLGDFGNNARGNRYDLMIYRVDKNSIGGRVIVDTIHFTYSEQKELKRSPYGNWTDFDCEAMIALDTALVLFTKEWISYGSAMYYLPKTPGNHVAIHKDYLDIAGLITGATYLEEENELFLVGYTNLLMPYIIRLYDYEDRDFFSGKIQKYSLPLSAHQVEGITFFGDYLFYVSNEFFQKLFVQTSAKLHRVDLRDYIIDNEEEYEE